MAADTPSAKDIRVAPITRQDADRVVKRVHYSGKVVPNSQLHLGVFLGDRLEGAMQFGPSMDKRKSMGLVRGTGCNGFLELNRMAFGERLPRNSESRALGVAMRMIRKAYPHIEWVQSFADGTQCGDGTIYRASGFVLTGIAKNKTLIEFPDGTRIANLVLTALWDVESVRDLCTRLGVPHKPRSLTEWKALGGRELPGFQLRYVYFLNPAARERLTVPVIPFDKIDELGAGMYRGERVTRSSRVKGQDSGHPPELGGSTPTHTLQSQEVDN
jgi:hypothetical protein